MNDMARSGAGTGQKFGGGVGVAKAQQTLFGYSRPHIEQAMSPDSNTVIIASKPGGQDLPLDAQSQRHDEMHGELTELAAANPALRILSGKGRSKEWGDENSFALTNVPDHLMPLIRQMAGRYKQDSILHSPVGTSDAFFTKPGGQRTGALTDPVLSNEEPSDFTQFGGGNLVFGGYRDMKQASEAMDAAWRMLIKERKSPEAMQHKREYDKAYESTPERVKYRVDLNRERRRRGIMGSRDHMDVSHTEGGKLTLEPEHSNRARHFKEQGTLRRLAKSAKDDIELLRNLLQGPMDEQDRLIATKLAENIKEKDDSEAEMAEEDTYQHLVRPSHD